MAMSDKKYLKKHDIDDLIEYVYQEATKTDYVSNWLETNSLPIAVNM